MDMSGMQPTTRGLVKVMAKVNKTYSLDPEVFMMLERYCSASDTWGKKKSRSKVVNEAIRWYISGDTADLVDSQEKLMAKVRELAMRNDVPVAKRGGGVWWKRLLGLN
jgi:hypothetical protein